MKTNSTAVRTKPKGVRVTGFMKKHKGSTKVIAFSLAFMMIFSVFSANISSIVRLLEAFAESTDYLNIGSDTAPKYVYYDSKLTLYDYKTDNELQNDGYDNNAYDGVNCNTIFNRALYESGYANAVWNSGAGNTKWPLYLGLQYPGQQHGNMMLKDGDNKYHYSIVANSEANSGTSGAALGLVDNILRGGDISQGGGKIVLPYFDEEFLTAPVSRLMSAGTVSANGLEGNEQLGSVVKNNTFKFIRCSDGYYKYRSASDRLGYSSNVYTVGPGGEFKYDLSWKDHPSKPAFFPWEIRSGHKGKFGYGAKFEIPFTMSSTGKTVPTDGAESEAIKFTFSGDDDVWVFIDDHLVLDVGGAHGAVSGEICFTKNAAYAKTNYIKTTSYSLQDGNASVAAGTEGNGGQVVMDDLFNNTLKLYDDITKEHTLTVFYLERGSLESNCNITFNFQIADTVTVTNKLKADGVNEFFTSDLKSVTDGEAVQYVMSSDSKTSGIDSPEKDKTEGEITPRSLYTVSFDVGGDYGSIPSKTVAANAEIVLPKGYKLNHPNYIIKGWNTSPDQTTPNVSSPYQVTGNVTLYAVWEKMPVSPLTPPPEPTLVYIVSDGYYITNTQFSPYGTIEEHWMYLANLTYRNLNYDNYKARVITKTGSTDSGDNRDHPNDHHEYSLTNTGLESIAYKSGADIVFAQNGGFYRWMITGEYASTLLKNNDYASYKSSHGAIHSGDDYGADTWIGNYYSLYTRLTNFCNSYSNVTDNTIRANYEAAVNLYKNMQYGDSAQDQALALMDQLDAAIVTYNNSHTTKYSYSTTDDVEIYVYATSAPSVVSANSYGNANYTDGNNDTRSYDSTRQPLSPVPDGHQEPSNDTGGTYYKFTVPKYVQAQTYDTSTSPETPEGDPYNVSNTITITAGGSSKTLTVEEMLDVSETYPCWYAASDILKGITEEPLTYTMTTPKIIWIYSTSATPTVKCINPYTNYENNMTVTHDSSDPDNFYWAKVYTTVTRSSGGSQDTLIKVNSGAGIASSTITAKGDAPCYFDTTNDSGWNNIVTLVVEKPDWWSGCYIHTGGGPLVTEWTSSVPMKHISGDFYYTFGVGSTSGFIYVVKESAGNLSWDSSQSVDLTVQTTDKYFTGPTNSYNSKYSFGSSGTITSSYTYYSYTATAKSTSRLSGSTSEPTRGLVPLATIEDPDDAQTNDPDDAQTNDPETTEPETTEPASGSASTNGQFVGSNDGNGGNFTKVGGTGFKLIDPNFKKITNGAQEHVVRRTSNTGEYNLMFNQSAKFSYQFARDSLLKVAETGNSYSFSQNDRNRGVTTSAPNGTLMLSSTNNEGLVPLYKRYKTTFEVKDAMGNTTTNNGQNERYHVGTPANDAALKLSNLDNSVVVDTGVSLEVIYTNEVRVADMQFTKTFTNDYLTELVTNYRNSNGNADPTFTFTVSFQNVFGGTTELRPYNGAYQVYNGSTYTDQTGGSFSVKFSDLYTVTSGSYTAKTLYFVIRDIPVYTEFIIQENIPTNADYEPVETTVRGKVTNENNTAQETADSDLNNAVYYTVTSPIASNTVAYQNQKVSNDYYLIITKTIDHAYYNTELKGNNNGSDGDDPAGLMARFGKDTSTLTNNITVGGGTSTSDDINGYQDATGAEQSFIFKIQEYDGNTLKNTFYETISFTVAGTKNRLIKVNNAHKYVITEETAWSWKYEPDTYATAVSPTTDNTASGVVVTVNANKYNASEKTVSIDGSSVTISNWAQASYTDKKETKTQTIRNIEGDVSVANNRICMVEN